MKEKIEKEVKFDILQKSQPTLIKALADFDKKKKLPLTKLLLKRELDEIIFE